MPVRRSTIVLKLSQLIKFRTLPLLRSRKSQGNPEHPSLASAAGLLSRSAILFRTLPRISPWWFNKMHIHLYLPPFIYRKRFSGGTLLLHHTDQFGDRRLEWELKKIHCSYFCLFLVCATLNPKCILGYICLLPRHSLCGFRNRIQLHGNTRKLPRPNRLFPW